MDSLSFLLDILLKHNIHRFHPSLDSEDILCPTICQEKENILPQIEFINFLIHLTIPAYHQVTGLQKKVFHPF